MIIIATVPTNPFNPEVVKKMILSGADIFRFNFNYELTTENIRRLEIFNELCDELHSPAKSLVDLPGCRIRFGRFSPNTFPVKEGTELTLQSAEKSDNPLMYLPIMIDNLGQKVSIGQTIPINDGEIMLEVIEIINDDSIKVRVLNNGTISIFRGFYIKNGLDVEKSIKSYTNILEQVKDLDIDYVAVPYTVNPEDYKKILTLIRPGQKIALKLEEAEGIKNIDKIINEYKFDTLIFDRGELGVNLPYEKLGLLQKQIIKKAKQANKSVIISTQIIESVTRTYIPFRSEITDLTNIILEGASGIMLCRETAVNERPTFAIHTAKRIISTVEKYTHQL